jgi:Holliday junction resolvase RusA-like endonuclease
MEQPLLPSMEWPALVAGPVFLCFEISGKPGHKRRHRYRKMIKKELWSYTGRLRYMTEENVGRIFIQEYPDPETEAYERMIAEYAGLLMNRQHHGIVTTKPVALVVHSFREIPKSWSKTDRAKALANNIRPTSTPDWDNYGKITDALNEVVWKDDSQVVDGRSLKYYSDRPALRIEVREMIEP